MPPKRCHGNPPDNDPGGYDHEPYVSDERDKDANTAHTIKLRDAKSRQNRYQEGEPYNPVAKLILS
jgi:hypothetical protein